MNWRAPSQVRICRPPLRSGHTYMKDAHSIESNEKSYFRYFRFLVMADCIYNLRVTPGFSSVSPTKKTNRSKVVKPTENMRNEQK